VVPVVDLSRRAGLVADDYGRAVERVLRSGWFLLGPELEALETELQRARPRTESDGVTGAGPCRQLGLQRFELGPEEQVTAAQHPGHRVLEGVEVFTAAPAQVDDRYHGCSR